MKKNRTFVFSEGHTFFELKNLGKLVHETEFPTLQLTELKNAKNGQK